MPRLGKSVLKRVSLKDNEIIKLIGLYRNSECLWDVRSAHYKNNILRKKALTNISNEMGLGVGEDFVKKKINSLRSTYLLEKKKINSSKTAGSGTDDVYTTNLPWYEEMTFLDDVILPRKTSSNFENGSRTHVEDRNCETEEADYDMNTTIMYDSQNSDAEASETKNIRDTLYLETSTAGALQEPPRKKRVMNNLTRASSSTVVDEAVLKLCEVTDQSSDSYDKFGASIASQLRELPKIEAFCLQADIQRLVTDRIVQYYSSHSNSTGSDNMCFKFENVDVF